MERFGSGMNSFKSLMKEKQSIGRKLAVNFMGLYAAALIVGILNMVAILSGHMTLQNFKNGSTVEMQIVGETQAAMIEYEKEVYRAVAANDLTVAAPILKEAEESVLVSMESLNQLLEISGNEDLIAKVQEINSTFSELDTGKATMTEIATAGKMEELYSAVEEEMAPVYDKLNTQFIEMVVIVSEQMDSKVQMAFIQMLSAMIVSVVLLTALAISAFRRGKQMIYDITYPVMEIEEAMVELENGNFSAKLAYTSENELGILADKIRETIAQLRTYIDAEAEVLEQVANYNLDVEITQEFKEIGRASCRERV